MHEDRAHIDRAVAVTAAVALVGDAVLITASVLHRVVAEDDPLGFLTLGRWNGNRDGTFAELWGGLQLVTAACALLLLAVLLRRSSRPSRASTVYIAWAAILATIAADDYFMIHERVGEFLVRTLDLSGVLGLRGQDLGELLVWSIFAAALGALVLGAHLRSPWRARRDSLVFLALTVFLAAFGVVLDMVNIALHDVVGDGALTVTTHLETGGELVAMTFLLLWSVHVLVRERCRADHHHEDEGRWAEDVLHSPMMRSTAARPGPGAPSSVP